LLRDFKKLSVPFDKLNSGVYSIQFYVKNKTAEGNKIVNPKDNFQSEISHETIAIRKIPIEKLTCKKIIIL